MPFPALENLLASVFSTEAGLSSSAESGALEAFLRNAEQRKALRKELGAFGSSGSSWRELLDNQQYSVYPAQTEEEARQFVMDKFGARVLFKLSLSWSQRQHPPRDGTQEEPTWSEVEECIERAFRAGGRVTLKALEQVLEPSEALMVRESIWMTSDIGRFRLTVIPEDVRDDTRTNLREWREAGDSPFRGQEKIEDDLCDARTICMDPEVAKSLFKEFFDHRGISEPLFGQIRSVWDRTA